MIRLPKPTRSSALLAALAGGLMLAAAPALAHDHRGPHHHHHHHGPGGKQVFYDGHCKVERKWSGHGYKEKVHCPHPPAVAYYPAPVVAYHPPPPVYVGPPVISVTIPIGR